MDIDRFNLRVYGLLMEQDKVLVTYENRGGILMTKFPGGGLEFGEGIKDCLVREFHEEASVTVKISEFFYVNDFLQISKFKKSDQLISFYYIVTCNELHHIQTEPFNQHLPADEQIFEWIKIEELDPDNFTFPIDRIVVEKLKAKF